MTQRNVVVIRALGIMVFGLVPLLRGLSNPRLAAAHGSDLMQLIAAGICFGVGIGLLAGSRKSSNG